MLLQGLNEKCSQAQRGPRLEPNADVASYAAHHLAMFGCLSASQHLFHCLFHVNDWLGGGAKGCMRGSVRLMISWVPCAGGCPFDAQFSTQLQTDLTGSLPPLNSTAYYCSECLLPTINHDTAALMCTRLQSHTHPSNEFKNSSGSVSWPWPAHLLHMSGRGKVSKHLWRSQ